MVNFATFKKNSSNIDALAAKITKMNKNKTEDYNNDDDRFWYPDVDKAGNGYAVIRFLPGPAVDGDDAAPFVKYFHHGFQTPQGKWYIENSLTSLDKKDPVGELNRRLWNSKVDEYVAIARKQKRKLNYISNIMVLEDSKNPENNGKVFLYRYGKKIFDKISEAMFPLFPDKQKFDPFNFWEGANFKLKIRNVSDFRNYDMSEFMAPSKLSDSDEELEKIWKSEYSLTDLVKYKSYDELKTKLDEAIGCDSSSEDVFSYLSATPVSANKTRAQKQTTKEVSTAEKDETPPWIDETEPDDDAAYFQQLAAKAA
jgi:hypothetical protein